ncbi:hypothetical protein H5410_002983 [Solanum commersonii]|uniref:MADS-box domain-containing protein n=1 Tax=Solanum commersonii TaxID=4109 RepID=A0A9J6B3V0_SOLCO|nr:hypothetical protein H5410_002983 [Solanum commersonii]
MAKEKTLGCQKILMAKIEDEDDLYTTFSKCCASLYKKASDKIEKYDIDMGIIIFSHNHFSFFHPTIDVVTLLILFLVHGLKKRSAIAYIVGCKKDKGLPVGESTIIPTSMSYFPIISLYFLYKLAQRFENVQYQSSSYSILAIRIF